MTDTIRLDGATVNAPDALELARFYAEITGGRATGTSHWAAAIGPHAVITFQQVEGFRPPSWPGSPESEVPMQLHLEFLVDDLDATGARVVAAGATRLDHQPNADHCLVYADPAGHPFCLSTWSGSQVADAATSSSTAAGEVHGQVGDDVHVLR